MKNNTGPTTQKKAQQPESCCAFLFSHSIAINAVKGGFSVGGFDPDIEEGLEDEQYGRETQGDRNVGGEGEVFKKEDANPGAAQSDGEGPT